jgi:hypothetical protein
MTPHVMRSGGILSRFAGVRARGRNPEGFFAEGSAVALAFGCHSDRSMTPHVMRSGGICFLSLLLDYAQKPRSIPPAKQEGHGFSRAINAPKWTGALAPEGNCHAKLCCCTSARTSTASAGRFPLCRCPWVSFRPAHDATRHAQRRNLEPLCGRLSPQAKS